MSKNPMQWTQTTPTLSRLDYIATAIYAAYLANPSGEFDITWADAVYSAKQLIAELDKEQQQWDT